MTYAGVRALGCTVRNAMWMAARASECPTIADCRYQFSRRSATKGKWRPTSREIAAGREESAGKGFPAWLIDTETQERLSRPGSNWDLVVVY